MNLGGVPSVVAPGEQIAVFNRHQQAKFGGVYPGGLEGFFSGHQRPHQYANGGMVAAANQLEAASFPYKWGGGHQATPAPFGPMDCSGAVSYVLQHGGINIPTMTSSGLMTAGKPGPGAVTIFANPEHTFMRIGGRYFGTSQTNPGGGAGWFPAPSAAYLARFTQRHFDASDVGGAFIDSIATPVIDGLGGAVEQIANVALQSATDAANMNLDSIAAASLGGGDANLPADAGAAKAYARSQLRKYGWGPGEWAPLNSLWQGESNWDANAVNHSSGAMGIPQALGHGRVFALGDYVAQIDWGLRYIKSRYGSPSKAYSTWLSRSPHWYAQGGIATMGPDQWARGGRIDRPTLMTGEDKGRHPEFVISTNPMFKDSNRQTLSAAASALGIPTARKGKKKRNASSPVALRPGSNVDKIPAVQRYSFLQQAEDDVQREISIATSKVKEPDTFIKQIGTDGQGNALYEVDESKIATYEKQLAAVRALWDRLIRIMDELAAAADAAYRQIHTYIKNRRANIAILNNVIQRERRLTRSKDDDTARRAEKRLEQATKMRDSEQSLIEDAKGRSENIKDDQHDAFFRRQEYVVSRGEVQADIDAVRGRAAEEAAGANPQPETPEPTTPPEPETPTGPTIFEQIATLSQARQDLYKQFGSNNAPLAALGTTIAGRPGASLGMPNFSFGGAIQSSNAAIRTISSGGGSSFAGVAGGSTSGGTVGGQTAAAGGGTMGGDTIVNVTNNFQTQPTDPHTWSKGLAYELKAAV
jgi:hypothetical protein